ncbi:hypothetical protein COO91_08258 [Nostoc flagelliforme CCNUN1]|uniref:Uncharacterized protein n=1 Tax=Nostoc flagelliforme CCNUN1 TaxID=2038116 RepID=A0A2K8T3A6_9NOSO|nr:hypothetical protein COO91_08258 [Nostoc flagelliforme CCNUN1]
MWGVVRIIVKFNRPPSFSTSNDVVLNDAFNILGEVVDAIDEVEQMTQKGEF